MSRILAIDYGAKRTGLAVTDPLKMIANPLEVIATYQLEEFLTTYFQTEEVEAVVLGMPKNTDGSDTDATPLVNAFINRFRKVFPDKKLVLHDEWFTSKLAFNAMIAGGLKKKDRQNKGMVDKVSATIILQSYLERIA